MSVVSNKDAVTFDTGTLFAIPPEITDFDGHLTIP